MKGEKVQELDREKQYMFTVSPWLPSICQKVPEKDGLDLSISAVSECQQGRCSATSGLQGEPFELAAPIDVKQENHQSWDLPDVSKSKDKEAKKNNTYKTIKQKQLHFEGWLFT